MGSAANVTTILYGTAWDDSTLLEEVKQANLELERKDSIKRHFRYDWQEVGRYNPDYIRFVQAERQRLGADHPLFRTQYALLPVTHGGGFLSRQQIAVVLGEHHRQSHPEEKKTYIAGVDLAGEYEQEIMGGATTGNERGRGHDSKSKKLLSLALNDIHSKPTSRRSQYPLDYTIVPFTITDLRSN